MEGKHNLKSELFTSDQFQLEYIQFGDGEEHLICFHGFGGKATDFQIFWPALEKRFRITSINLLGHQNSRYPANRISSNQITAPEFKDLFQQFLHKLNIDTFSLMGYSLGGKIALLLVQFFPNQVRNIYLLAPDGIKPNFWYDVATKTALGNNLYPIIISHPSYILKPLRFITKLGLVPKSLAKFVQHNLAKKSRRELVYKSWMIHKNLSPTTSIIKKSIIQSNVHVFLFYGLYDKVIPYKQGNRFAKAIFQSQNVFILKTGHNLLQQETLKKLKEIV